MIKNGEIPSYKVFTHEPAKKRQKRLAKENREAKEAEELQNELGLDSGTYSYCLNSRNCSKLNWFDVGLFQGILVGQTSDAAILMYRFKYRLVKDNSNEVYLIYVRNN